MCVAVFVLGLDLVLGLGRSELTLEDEDDDEDDHQCYEDVAFFEGRGALPQFHDDVRKLGGIVAEEVLLFPEDALLVHVLDDVGFDDLRAERTEVVVGA